MVGDPRAEFSEWLHHELVNAFMIERAAWALDRVRRVQERLNQIRPEKVQLETTILEIAPPLAFTTVGRHVYLSRHLLERLPTDDAVAFVLAHEAGHHDLGHLDLFAGWSRVLPRTNSSAWVAILANYLEHHAYGPSREDAADAYAVSVCMRAGYNGGLSVQALTILETLALDAGDINGVYGPENLLDPTDPKRDSAAYLIQRWVWTHLHGYNPLHERVAKVRKLVRECAT